VRVVLEACDAVDPATRREAIARFKVSKSAFGRRRDRTFNCEEVLMPRPAISGVVSITFLMLLEFSAVSQEPARKGADTEAAPTSTDREAWCRA
jgi:hypothetical protein